MKKQNFHIIACLCAATVFFTSCNSKSSTNNNSSTASDTTAASAPASAKASQPKADTAFMAGVAAGGMMEVELGRIALKNAKNKQVKEFGSMMITDHTKIGDELKSLASGEGVTLPDSLSTEQQEMVKKMKKMMGSAFDKHYIGMMVNGHEKVLDAFKNEESTGKDSVIIAFAGRNEPTIQKHLDAAKAAEQALTTNP